MEQITLQATTRQKTKKKGRVLMNNEALIPAVLYGRNIKNENLSVPYTLFEKVIKKAGESSFLDLSIDEGKPLKVLIHDFQLHPVSGKYIHVDFYQIRMDEKIQLMIELNFIGNASAVKDLGGILLANLDHIEVRCLPKDLVKSIDVPIDGLKTFDNAIYVKDLNIPAGIEILSHANDLIAKVIPPRSEKELEDLDAKPVVDVDAVEVEKKAAKPDEDADAENPPTSEKKSEQK